MRYIFGIGMLAIIGSIYPPDIIASALTLGVVYGVLDIYREV